METQLHLAQLAMMEGRGATGQGNEREREEGVKENEPTDNPICSTELVMPGCSSTCF